MNYVLIVCLIFAGLASRVECQSSSLTKEKCVETIRRIETVSGFIDFANILIAENDSAYNEQVSITKIINRCLHSVSGIDDLEVLQEVVLEAAVVHSVCEPNYVKKLLEVGAQLKQNASRGKILGRKQKNRLSKFFRLFAGQVALTCKKSLIQKLQSAEENNDKLNEALDRIVGLSTKNTEGPLVNVGKIPATMRKLFSLATKYTPTIFTRVENVVLFESLKPTSDAVFSINITLNTNNMLDEFMKTKQACTLIDRYAQSSINAIARLAWKGYLARDDDDIIDRSLIREERVQKWIKVVQCCQGVLIVRARLDLDQESMLKLDKDILNDDQIITVNVNRDYQAVLDQISISREVHKYDQMDTITNFDDDLVCYTYSNGLTGWLMKRLGKGERSLAKHIKMSVLDETFERSMFNDDEDLEGEVQFVGSGGMASQAFSHVTNHVAVGTAATHHFHYLGGSIAAQVSIISIIICVALFFLTWFAILWASSPDKIRS